MAYELSYKQAIGTFERLAAADPSNSQWQLDLVVSYMKIVFLDSTEEQEDMVYLENAYDILQLLESAGKLHGGHKAWPHYIKTQLNAIKEKSSQ